MCKISNFTAYLTVQFLGGASQVFEQLGVAACAALGGEAGGEKAEDIGIWNLSVYVIQFFQAFCIFPVLMFVLLYLRMER
jgi:hypothetical protein